MNNTGTPSTLSVNTFVRNASQPSAISHRKSLTDRGTYVLVLFVPEPSDIDAGDPNARLMLFH
jgi:hypothetical protein